MMSLCRVLQVGEEEVCREHGLAEGGRGFVLLFNQVSSDIQ